MVYLGRLLPPIVAVGLVLIAAGAADAIEVRVLARARGQRN